MSEADHLAEAQSEIARLRAELDETNRGVVALYAELDEQAERLAEADRRKNDFLAMLAHELRNPLAVARLAIEDLEESRASRLLERQVEHLERMIRDLLDVSRVVRRKVELKLEPLDLGALVRLSVEDRRTLLESHSHPLTVELPEEPLPIEGDPVRLSQVLANLLDNASKYSEPGDPIAIRLWREGEEGLIEVSDHGRGLDPEEKEAIFELFVQTRRGLDRERGGLGIGLTLARELMRLHGGQIGVRSPGRGQGSTFTLRLPLASGAPARARSEPAIPPPPAVPSEARAALSPKASPEARPREGEEGIRLLLVEDTEDLRELLASSLSRSGFAVEQVANGADALDSYERALASGEGFGLVVTDLGLPGLDGYQLAEAIRSRGSKVPLIALTGYGSARDEEKARAAGFDAHLVKPVSISDLLSTTQEVLASRRPA